MHRDGVYGDDASNTVVHRRVLQWSTRTPDSVALEFGDRRFVYADLATAACRIAAGLRRQGVGPDVPVGVHLPRSERLVIAHLAVLAAGGAYLTLDPAQPDKALADQIAIMHKGAIARRGTLRDIVDDHPARIAFDHPGLPVPQFRGARVDAGARVTISTNDLQGHLFELLGWAREAGVRLTGLEARAASLESVFLDIAEATTPTLIGAR